MREQPVRPGELPVFQNYACHSCGRCCRGWFEVPVTEAERERILGLGWADRVGLPPEALFARRGDAWRLRHRPDGACVFLGDDQRCRIHAADGAESKPLACRLYPYHFVPVGAGVRVEVRFDCPSVAGNLGPSLAAQAAELADLARRQAGGAVTAPAAPELTAGVPADWALLDHLAGLAGELWLREDRPLVERLIALGRFSFRLRTAPLGALQPREVAQVLGSVATRAVEESATMAAAPELGPPGGMTRALFRQLLAAYGRADRVDAPRRVGSRLSVALRMLAGSGPIPFLRDDLPPSRFVATEDARGLVTPETAGLLTRYYRLRLHSLGFCGRACYGWSFVDGLDALLLTFPIVGWYAKMLAAADGRETVVTADVTRAVGLVDGAHGRSALLAMPSERRKIHHLSRPGPLLVLTRWYGS